MSFVFFFFNDTATPEISTLSLHDALPIFSHSRMRRYEILMEFAGEQKEIPSEALSDVMLLDLYLRENLKSRPSFASDQKPYERLIWDYRKAKKIPKTAHIEVFRDGKKLLFDYTDRDPLTNNAQLTDITDEVNDNYGNV